MTRSFAVPVSLLVAAGAIAGCPAAPEPAASEAVIRAQSPLGVAGPKLATPRPAPSSDSLPGRSPGKLPASAIPIHTLLPSPGAKPSPAPSFDADATGVAVTYARDFDEPRGVAVDAAGVVYVAEFGAHRLRAISIEREVSMLAGTGRSGSDNGAAEKASFNNPMGLAVDGPGRVLAVADYFNNRVRRLTADEDGRWTAATMASKATGDALEGPGQTQDLWYPTAVAIDAWGRVAVADSYNDRVRMLTASGGITTLGAGGLGRPGGVAVDAQGNLYVSDTQRHRIVKLAAPAREGDEPPSATGRWTLTVLAGTGVAGQVDGKGAEAKFSEPRGLAVNKDGHVYVADAGNHCVRKIVIDAKGVVTVSTVAGTGSPGYVDGSLSRVKFDTPTAVAVDAKGRVYVADTKNDAIRRIQ